MPQPESPEIAVTMHGRRPVMPSVAQIITAVYFLALPVAGLFALVSPMMTDAPGASGQTITQALILLHVTLPVTLIAALQAKRADRAAGHAPNAAFYLPVLHLLALAVTWILNITLCGGEFACR